MWRPILVVILTLVLLGCGGDQGEKYLQAGFAYFQQHDYDRAIENYEKAIASGAKSAGAYNMLGMAYRFKYQQTGNPELQQNEIDAFQKAVNIDPKYWVAMINLGTTYYSRGEKAQAASWLKKALALNPNHPEKAQIEKMIAEGAKEAGKPGKKPAPPGRENRDDSGDSAEKYLEQGVAHFQKQEYDWPSRVTRRPSSWNLKAPRLTTCWAWPTASSTINWAIRILSRRRSQPSKGHRHDPRYWGAMINLGATYYYMGEKAKAAALFKQALTVNPNHPEKPSWRR